MATSMALLVDTVGVTPAYCSGATGCHAAQLAAKEVFGSVPLPLLGLLAFSGLLAVTTLKGGPQSRRLELAGAIAAAVCGLAFLCVQAFVIKSFCPLCVVVDVSAIVACVALFGAQRAEIQHASLQWLHPVAVGGLAAVACLAPVIWPHFRPTAAMPAQLAEFERSDRVTVVEFADFSCGHCRALYPTLEKLRKEAGNRIQFVRLQAPLRSHRHAREAARLLQCLIPDEPRIEKLTEVLFENPELDRSTIIAAAQVVGMTQDEIDACWADPSSEASLDDNVKLLESLGFQGLPTTYVGGERIVGDMPLPVYVAALDRVRRSGNSAVAEGATFYALFGMLVLGILLVGRRGS